jgi:hypothetical protein
MGIEKMSQGSISANQDKLFKRRAGAAGFQQPKKPFYRHIHNLFWRFLNGCQVQNMGDTGQRFLDRFPMLNGAAHNFEAGVWSQGAIVAEGTHDEGIKLWVGQETLNKHLAHFSRCASNQYAFHVDLLYGNAAAVSRYLLLFLL